jgi:threonine aldolase
LTEDFAFHVKQRGGMLAKGRLLGIQFQELFGVKNLFFENAKHANVMAAKLASGIVSSGYGLEAETATNQVFPILPDSVISALQQHFAFYVWRKADNEHSAIRLVTSWATQEHAVDAFLARLAQL